MHRYRHAQGSTGCEPPDVPQPSTGHIWFMAAARSVLFWVGGGAFLAALGVCHGGATTTGLDATHPPTIFQNLGGAGGAVGGGSSRGSGGVPPGGRGGSGRGSGGGSGRGSWGLRGSHTRTGPGRPPWRVQQPPRRAAVMGRACTFGSRTMYRLHLVTCSFTRVRRVSRRSVATERPHLWAIHRRTPSSPTSGPSGRSRPFSLLLP